MTQETPESVWPFNGDVKEIQHYSEISAQQVSFTYARNVRLGGLKLVNGVRHLMLRTIPKTTQENVDEVVAMFTEARIPTGVYTEGEM